MSRRGLELGDDIVISKKHILKVSIKKNAIVLKMSNDESFWLTTTREGATSSIPVESQCILLDEVYFDNIRLELSKFFGCIISMYSFR